MNLSQFVKGLLIIPFVASLGYTQVLKPASWELSWSATPKQQGEKVELILKATIDKDWYLYSNDFDPNLGPMLTEFKFEPSSNYQLIGKTVPIKPKKKFDDVWGGEYTYFVGKGEFRQKLKALNEGSVKVSISYQVCTETDGKCIPFDEEFEIEIPSLLASTEVKSESKTEIPADNQAEADTISASPAIDTIVVTSTEEVEKSKNQVILEPEKDQSSLLGFFFLAFGAGLIALLTPCVFPMIPMTVTFFTRSNTSRLEGIKQALFYGFSIIAIYTVIGTLVAKTVGPEAANFLSTHWLPNLFFFLIFLVFAFSFLGMFEIVLPAWLVNKADRQSDKGGLYGVFFMAFTIVLVSFSCTGPLVGSILVESARGANLKPIIGMFGFSLAFAIPFSLFAIFPGWLSSLPKSGGWLNTVKVLLGFLELALALKFLSIADQVYHWGILDRDVFLAIWIAIFALMGVYLLGGIRLPHDSPTEKISVSRLLSAVLTFSFVIYLIPGLWGAPLKALTGYLPPLTGQDFNLSMQTKETGGASAKTVRYSELFKLPHQLEGYFDYKEALQASKNEKKPLFIDFTGHGCVNCREMEARVWSHPAVWQRLKEDYVVLALYVDDKTTLPESEWLVSKYDGKMKKTIGSINADLQITKFNNNAQPYYVLLNSNGDLLVQPKAYDLEVQRFIDFLDEGKRQYLASSGVN
jgi:thiol:disulfide interchange protein